MDDNALERFLLEHPVTDYKILDRKGREVGRYEYRVAIGEFKQKGGARPCVIDGVAYSSRHEAAKQLNINPKALRALLREQQA